MRELLLTTYCLLLTAYYLAAVLLTAYQRPAERLEGQRRCDGTTYDLVAVAEEAVLITVGAAGEKPSLSVREGRVHPARGEDGAASWPASLSPAKELRHRDLTLRERSIALARALAQSHLHQRLEGSAGAARSAKVVGRSTDEHAHKELGWQRVDGLEHRESGASVIISVLGSVRGTHGVLLEDRVGVTTRFKHTGSRKGGEARRRAARKPIADSPPSELGASEFAC